MIYRDLRPFGHNEAASVCRIVLIARGEPFDDGLIYRFASRYNGDRDPEAVAKYFTELLDARKEFNAELDGADVSS